MLGFFCAQMGASMHSSTMVFHGLVCMCRLRDDGDGTSARYML
jgi:hypothetical protein